MSMNSQGRPTSPEHMSASYIETVSGSRGLLQAEDLLFEIGTEETTGVDLPEPKNRTGRLGGVAIPGLPTVAVAAKQTHRDQGVEEIRRWSGH